MFERLVDKIVIPSYSDMITYCGKQGEAFEQFNAWVADEFLTDSEIKFPYGNSYGWCVSHHRKSKLICNVFPEKGSFCVMVRKTDKQFAAVYEKVSDYAKKVIDSKYQCGNGGWIHFHVKNEADYKDIIMILHAPIG